MNGEVITREEIESFIYQFRYAKETFLNGCCFWFAYILNARFPNSRIMYDPVYNHFVTEINGYFWDVTGDTNQTYACYVWDDYMEFEPYDAQRVIDQCIMKYPKGGM